MTARLRSIVFFAAAALALCTSLVHADIMITPGPGSNVGTDNVVFNPCSGIVTGPALTIQGCLNSSTSTIIDFTSNENLIADGGQARIESSDGAFNVLTINIEPLATSSFTSLIFNINTDADDNTGTIIINVQPNGEPLVVSSPFSLANGENFFRVDAINGEDIQFVNFVSTVGITSVLFDDVRQVRVGGVGGIGGEPGSVPEPGTIVLLGLGVTAFAIARRKISV